MFNKLVFIGLVFVCAPFALAQTDCDLEIVDSTQIEGLMKHGFKMEWLGGVGALATEEGLNVINPKTAEPSAAGEGRFCYRKMPDSKVNGGLELRALGLSGPKSAQDSQLDASIIGVFKVCSKKSKQCQNIGAKFEASSHQTDATDGPKEYVEVSGKVTPYLVLASHKDDAGGIFKFFVLPSAGVATNPRENLASPLMQHDDIQPFFEACGMGTYRSTVAASMTASVCGSWSPKLIGEETDVYRGEIRSSGVTAPLFGPVRAKAEVEFDLRCDGPKDVRRCRAQDSALLGFTLPI